MWNNGIREWKYASAVASDWNDMVMEYLTINELSLEAMNFGKWVAENQQKKSKKEKWDKKESVGKNNSIETNNKGRIDRRRNSKNRTRRN